jgi:hypothetical protein
MLQIINSNKWENIWHVQNSFWFCFKRQPLFLIIYARFIDDIFLEVNEDFDIDILINSFENLVLNVVSEKSFFWLTYNSYNSYNSSFLKKY